MAKPLRDRHSAPPLAPWSMSRRVSRNLPSVTGALELESRKDTCSSTKWKSTSAVPSRGARMLICPKPCRSPIRAGAHGVHGVPFTTSMSMDRDGSNGLTATLCKRMLGRVAAFAAAVENPPRLLMTAVDAFRSSAVSPARCAKHPPSSDDRLATASIACVRGRRRDR